MDKYVLPNNTLVLVVPLGSTTDFADVTGNVITYKRLAPDEWNEATTNTDVTLVATDDGKCGVQITFDATELGIRSVWGLVVSVTSSAGTEIIPEKDLMVQTSQSLVKGVNSYQSSYELALNLEEIPGIDSFRDLTADEQLAYLAQAYNILNTLTYVDSTGEHWNIGEYDATELNDLEPEFLKALQIAQIIEANEASDPNSIHYKRLSGLMSETIGESSMMFKSGRADNSPITRRSMMFLRNYILVRARLARA